MFSNLFEIIDSVIKGVAYFCLLLVAACVSLFVLYFVAMTAYRMFWMCWDLIFSHDWVQ